MAKDFFTHTKVMSNFLINDYPSQDTQPHIYQLGILQVLVDWFIKSLEGRGLSLGNWILGIVKIRRIYSVVKGLGLGLKNGLTGKTSKELLSSEYFFKLIIVVSKNTN